MSNKKHNWIIIASLVGAPILFFTLGLLSSFLLDKLRPEYIGTGPGLGAGLVWTFGAVLSLIASLVFGPLLSYMLRNNDKPGLALLGYIIPPVSAFLLCTIATISIFINIDKGS